MSTINTPIDQPFEQPVDRPAAVGALPLPARTNYLNADYSLKSWLLTKDHKRIALLYLVSVSFFFFIGSVYAMMIRLELLTPTGDLVQAATYNKLFTHHGIIMIFLFLSPYQRRRS